MRRLLFILLIWPVMGWAVGDPFNAEIKRQHPPHPEENGLRLEVNATLDDGIISDGNTWGWAGASLSIEVALQNISEVSITVPTTAFDGPPIVFAWPGWGETIERILISIDSPKFQGKPAAYAASRFAPVTLAPGEFAFLYRHHASIPDRKHADSIKEASVAFGVSSQFVGPKEWWRGRLATYAEIKRRTDPDKEIEEKFAYERQRTSEEIDPAFFKKVPGRVAALIASADQVRFRGEDEAKNSEVVLRDLDWIRRMGEAVAMISVSNRVACLCSGWRTASFYKGEERVVSVAAIHGDQLRIYWKNGGGDFPIDATQWKVTAAVLEAGYAASTAGHPTSDAPH